MRKVDLSKVLELLLSEQKEEASRQLHEWFVAKSKAILEDLMQEDDDVLDEIESDKAEIEAEEFYGDADLNEDSESTKKWCAEDSNGEFYVFSFESNKDLEVAKKAEKAHNDGPYGDSYSMKPYHGPIAGDVIPAGALESLYDVSEEEFNSDEMNGPLDEYFSIMGDLLSDYSHERESEEDSIYEDEGDADDEMPVEDKIDDLEAQLAELKAEFDALMGSEEAGDIDLDADVSDEAMDSEAAGKVLGPEDLEDAHEDQDSMTSESEGADQKSGKVWTAEEISDMVEEQDSELWEQIKPGDKIETPYGVGTFVRLGETDTYGLPAEFVIKFDNGSTKAVQVDSITAGITDHDQDLNEALDDIVRPEDLLDDENEPSMTAYKLKPGQRIETPYGLGTFVEFGEEDHRGNLDQFIIKLDSGKTMSISFISLTTGEPDYDHDTVISEREVEEDFKNLEESFELELVKDPDMSEGKEAGNGGKQTVSKTSPIPQRKTTERVGGKAVEVKGKTHKGYDREAAPKVNTQPLLKNQVKNAKDELESVKPEGDKSALLNKAPETDKGKSPIGGGAGNLRGNDIKRK